MEIEISAMKARQNLGQLLEEVFYKGDRVIIKRAKKPMAVLIPIQDYTRLEQNRKSLLDSYKEIWELNQNIPPSKTDADIKLAIKDIRNIGKFSISLNGIENPQVLEKELEGNYRQ